MDAFLEGFGPTTTMSLLEISGGLALSFVLGSILAAVYRWTHYGVSYSRSFVQTLVLACIVATIMIVAIGNNLARGLGILGALAIIRFRTPIRDPRDIIFLFASLAIGISTGSQLIGVAVVGTLAFSFCALLLNLSPTTSKREMEGLLRFMAPADNDLEKQLFSLFRHFTHSVELIAMREAVQGELLEYAYQIRLMDPALRDDLVSALSQVEGISEVNLIMQRETVEI